MVKKSLLMVLIVSLAGFVVGLVSTLWEYSAETVLERFTRGRITKVIHGIFYAGCLVFGYKYFKKNFPQR